ncbi:hypothetical protein PYCC9005_005971 [Savitreella phatthalungensis]
MSSDLGKHAQAFTGRGGAGNYVIKNPIPPENMPKEYTAKPVAGNLSGRGGAGNFKWGGPAGSSSSANTNNEANFGASQSGQSARDEGGAPVTFRNKAGRGGAGNIEAVKITGPACEEEREIDEMLKVQQELRDAGVPPHEIEMPILRVD